MTLFQSYKAGHQQKSPKLSFGKFLFQKKHPKTIIIFRYIVLAVVVVVVAVAAAAAAAGAGVVVVVVVVLLLLLLFSRISYPSNPSKPFARFALSGGGPHSVYDKDAPHLSKEVPDAGQHLIYIYIIYIYTYIYIIYIYLYMLSHN